MKIFLSSPRGLNDFKFDKAIPKVMYKYKIQKGWNSKSEKI